LAFDTDKMPLLKVALIVRRL